MANIGVHEAWSDPDSPWTRWTKGVLFAFMPALPPGKPTGQPSEWTVPLLGDTAIVADTPGSSGVRLGISLSRSGYRPIPVYNACPFATQFEGIGIAPSLTRVEPLGIPSIVDLVPVMRALRAYAPSLTAAALPASAPPVFLIDSDRRGPPMGNSVEFFDNRSFVSPADFPSAKLFGEHGVSKIVVIQWELTMPSDLRHVLLSLQQGGMTIWRQDSYLPWSPRPMEIAPPNIVVRAWEWLWRALGYKRQMSGYFGGIRPASG